MPLSSAATSTAFTNATTRNVKGGQVVQLNLRMNGVSFVPADLFTALETLYGSGRSRRLRMRWARAFST
jgi:hypothetical protein